MKNYYAILEVPVGCSLEEIRQAYHRLVQENLDDALIFAELKEAYEVLTTPSRRDDYDRAAWGETFDSFSGNSFAAAPGFGDSAAPAIGRCPMGAEAQCPVLLGRAGPADKFCPECGYGLAALVSGATFEPAVSPEPARRAWLEDRSGQAHGLRIGVNIAGRESADVLVPDKTVSRNHARLEMDEAGSVTVEDMSSTNGTYVNDVPLMAHVPQSLADGDRLRFGSVSLILHLAEPDAELPELAGATGPEAGAQVTEVGEGPGRTVLLTPGITTFGRRAENTVVLTGDLYVSGRHAQISADGDVFILTDLGSTNGTLLNGERLQINTPVTLDAGDVIVIGGTALRFEKLGSEIAEAVAESGDEAEPITDNVPAGAADQEHSEIQAEDAPTQAEG